jgi:hypothetical protein
VARAIHEARQGGLRVNPCRLRAAFDHVYERCDSLLRLPVYYDSGSGTEDSRVATEQGEGLDEQVRTKSAIKGRAELRLCGSSGEVPGPPWLHASDTLSVSHHLLSVSLMAGHAHRDVRGAARHSEC